jgi:Family of unknown function (DUF6206)
VTGAPGGLPADAAGRLEAFERTLDCRAPAARGDCEVLGFGEVSAALVLSALPGWVCKRMSGFADAAMAERHAALIHDSIARIRASGVAVVDSVTITVGLPGRRAVVYLVQPRLDAAGMGNVILQEGTGAEAAGALQRVLDPILRVWRGNRERDDGIEVGLDAQLSNWHFRPGGPDAGEGALLDVGTPFVRRTADGAYLLDVEVFLSAVPAGLRAHYRRTGAVESYLADYFVPRRVALDVLGNFHKEGRPDRLPAALECVNSWLAGHAGELADARPLTAAEVAEYYREDARQLELFLRLRRLDRFLRTRVLRRRYDFVLPGRVRR